MPLRIFLVEDNVLIRRTMQEMLEDIVGARVVGWADTEAGAIDAMRSTDWDVALVDLFLQQGSGIGVARAFSEREPGRRVCVVTNYATPSIRERCSSVGVDAVFDKSTELDRLLAVLGDAAPP